MKYLVDLIGYNTKYKFPKHGETVILLCPLSEDESNLSDSVKKTKMRNVSYTIHSTNNEGNEAGFGWLWLYNPKTRSYDIR